MGEIWHLAGRFCGWPTVTSLREVFAPTLFKVMSAKKIKNTAFFFLIENLLELETVV